MAASNKQPAGSRPGPKAANVHAPAKGITNKDGGKSKPAAQGTNGVNGHGTPKPVGGGKGNPLR